MPWEELAPPQAPGDIDAIPSAAAVCVLKRKYPWGVHVSTRCAEPRGSHAGSCLRPADKDVLSRGDEGAPRRNVQCHLSGAEFLPVSTDIGV